ncbi:hypothetical protein BGX34_011225 [Mortierella sp. NVP85]|nr:hypothetical protein BGX34_011225 [Mortierella sp. NVP85]
MPPPRPLDLPEIISHIASYISERSRPACARVSKAWYRALLPFIWEEIKLSDWGRLSLEAIQSHSNLVKKLEVGNLPTQEHLAFRCPNLVLLRLIHALQDEDSLELIAEHPSVSDLHLSGSMARYPAWFWDKLIGFSNLKTLAVPFIKTGAEDIDKFWQLCTRLERLTLTRPYFSRQGSLASMEFPHLWELSMVALQPNDISWALDFIRRCPGLKSLYWEAGSDVTTPFILGLKELIVGRTLPKFHSLSILRTVNPDAADDVLKVIQCIQPITALKLHNWQDEGMRLFEVLRPQFGHLRILSLRYTTSITSAMVQEIMSSCPLLNNFSGPTIDAIDIVQGQPWVCLRLQFLDLRFRFDPSTIDRVQPLVFDQLARLTRLEELLVNEWYAAPKFQETFDLRLVHGLGKLSTLRLLEAIHVNNTVQQIGEEELEWMVEHWKSLWCIDGKLNMVDVEVDMALKERLARHGIAH